MPQRFVTRELSIEREMRATRETAGQAGDEDGAEPRPL